jgi:hypothetical protein
VPDDVCSTQHNNTDTYDFSAHTVVLQLPGSTVLARANQHGSISLAADHNKVKLEVPCKQHRAHGPTMLSTTTITRARFTFSSL